MYLKLRSTDSTKEASVNRLNGSRETVSFLPMNSRILFIAFSLTVPRGRQTMSRRSRWNKTSGGGFIIYWQDISRLRNDEAVGEDLAMVGQACNGALVPYRQVY